MFLEEEVYGMLNSGFCIVMLVQFVFVAFLWKFKGLNSRSFVYFCVHIILFSLAGYNLLIAINTFENSAGMGSEEASLRMAVAGLLWLSSVTFLLMSLYRLNSRNVKMFNKD